MEQHTRRGIAQTIHDRDEGDFYAVLAWMNETGEDRITEIAGSDPDLLDWYFDPEHAGSEYPYYDREIGPAVDRVSDAFKEATNPAEQKLIDVLASEARTALDDPAAVGIPESNVGGRHAYAIERLDEIITMLNPASETPQDYAFTLTMLGRQLAERADVIETSELSYPEHDAKTRTAYEEAHTAIMQACDLLDGAIEALNGDPA